MRFTLEKKMVAQVRYYEHLYLVRDDKGERLYTGTDEKTARLVQKLLNGYYARRAHAAKKISRKGKRK